MARIPWIVRGAQTSGAVRLACLASLLAVAMPAPARKIVAAEPAGKPLDDERLGKELRHLWPLSKPAYVNRQGKVVLQVEGDSAHEFAEGLAAVEVGDQWGFIDPRGQWVIRPRFSNAGSFSEGLAPVQLDHQWGYVDRSGKIVISPRFSEAGSFRGGAAVVNTGEAFNFHYTGAAWHGVIDKKGEWILPPLYGNANGYAEGLARVSGPKDGLVDTQGRLVLDLAGYQGGWPGISEGLITVEHEGLYGYMDRHGKWQIEPQFRWGELFSEGMAAVKLPDKGKADDETDQESETRWGYVDRSGKLVIPPQFAEAGRFRNGLAAVRPKMTEGCHGKGDRWGYIDRTGKFVIPLDYNEAWDFSAGLAWVHRGGTLEGLFMHQPPQWRGGKWLLIDKRGTVVWTEPKAEPHKPAKGSREAKRR